MGKKINALVTLLIRSDYYGGTTLRIADDASDCRLIDITITDQQLANILSRLSDVKCKGEIYNLNVIGKQQEYKNFEFLMPKSDNWCNDKEEAKKEAIRLTPKGWIPDTLFNSQSSFFNKDGKQYARTMIRRWVDKNKED